MRCICCDKWLSDDVYEYSLYKYGAPLCRDCQKILRENNYISVDALILFNCLKDCIKSSVTLEHYDKHKHVDIAILEFKFYIEVDGENHNYDADQALADLMRDYYSFKDGFYTLRVPNSLIRQSLGFVIEWIEKFLILRGYKPVYTSSK